MTTTATITLDKRTLTKYLEKLEELGRSIDEIMDKAVLAGAEVCQAEMKRLAPVKTGNLRDHIKIKGPMIDGSYHWVEVGIIHDKAFTDAETARYATVQEYGSSTTPAHPYIRPGTDNSKTAARAAMRKVFKEAFKEIIE